MLILNFDNYWEIDANLIFCFLLGTCQKWQKPDFNFWMNNFHVELVLISQYT